MNFTFICPTEVCQFNDRKTEFDDINVQLIGVSCDSKFSHRAFTLMPRNKGGLGPMQVPMVSDITKSISRNYGCLVDSEDEEAGVALRATYIIGPDGVLRHKTVSDFAVGRNLDETLRLVKGFQHTDEHGTACPSGWQPGNTTFHPEHGSDSLTSFWENEHSK